MSNAGEKLFDRAIFIASLVVIVAVVGGLFWYGFTIGSGPAELEATITDTEQKSGDERVYLVTVENKGGKTVEDLILEVSAGEESREVEIRFVTKGDSEEVFVSFPGEDKPEVRVVSYTER